MAFTRLGGSPAGAGVGVGIGAGVGGCLLAEVSRIEIVDDEAMAELLLALEKRFSVKFLAN